MAYIGEYSIEDATQIALLAQPELAGNIVRSDLAAGLTVQAIAPSARWVLLPSATNPRTVHVHRLERQAVDA